jgi:leucyl aminopeptidase
MESETSMDFSTRTAAADAVKADCVAVGVFAEGELSTQARAVDAASRGALRAAVKSGDVTGKRGTSVMLRALPGVAAARVLLVGLGSRREFGDKAFIEAVRVAVKAAGPAVKELAIAAADWLPAGRDSQWQARQLVLAAREAVFRLDELKSRKEDGNGGPGRVVLVLAARDAAAEHGLAQGTAIANGVELAKRLGNLPANICTPGFLADEARRLGRSHKLRVEILDRKQIESLKMGSFMSVARGSTEPPRLIVIKYDGAGAKGRGATPVVLVGKGITFDSGGISIKPANAMDEMKFDMCGAAAVFGALRAAAELKLKLNVIGVVPACENLPSGHASKPGDIVTSMSGQTIEVLNTDAEGRLILCDALTYAERFKPAAVVDIATLTGACVVALGDINSGLFSADDALADELLAAAKTAVDPAWRMPVQDEYQESLKSNFADMANIGAPGKAGAVTAACFLARFTKAYPWAHLDIAGTSWKSGPAKGATGRPVPLLAEFLMQRAG